MKRTTVVIALLMAMCLLFSGCTAGTTETRLKGYDTSYEYTHTYNKKQFTATNKDFSQTYTVANQGLEIYSADYSSVSGSGDGAYIQSKTYSPPQGTERSYIDTVVSVTEMGALVPGYYQADFYMTIGSASGTAPVMDIRAFYETTGEKYIRYDVYSDDDPGVKVDTKNFEVLNYRPLTGSDIKPNTETAYTLTFVVYENLENVNLWVATYGYLTPPSIKVSKIEVKGIEPEDQMEVMDLKSYFFNELEDDIEYDEDTLYVMDCATYIGRITDSRISYDILALISTIQGIVNRDGQHLWIQYSQKHSEGDGMAVADTNSDYFWLDYLTREGQFMNGKRIEMISSPGTILRLFRDKIKGLVVWDEEVAATSNVALTICGVEDLVCVRFDAKANSLMSLLIEECELEVKHTLVNKFTGEKGSTIWDTETLSTGSAKNDAYIWAKEKYLDTGLCSSDYMGNVVDSYTYDTKQIVSAYYNLFVEMITNKDFLVSKKAFIWDLYCLPNYIPNDDPYQDMGTDYRTAVKILYAQNIRQTTGDSTHLVGFPPWWLKYTDNCEMTYVPSESGQSAMSEPVQTEWGTSKLYGYFNICKDADAYGITGLCNASILSQTPLLDEYEQSGRYSVGNIDPEFASITSKEDIPEYTYLLIYMGDYDCGAWGNRFMPTYFNDVNLNAYPLCWPVTTGLMGRIPNVYNFIYSKAGENTYFVGGDNGYGYQNAEFMDLREDLWNPEYNNFVNNEPYLTEEEVSKMTGSVESYVDQCKKWYDFMDIDVMGFYISQVSMTDKIIEGGTNFIHRIAKMTPAGFGFTTDKMTGYTMPHFTKDGIPVIKEGLVMSDVSDTKNIGFKTERWVLKSPTWMKRYLDDLETKGYKVLDPYTFYYLYSIYFSE